MIDVTMQNVFEKSIEVSAFFSPIVGLVAALIMSRVTTTFGKGVIAKGFTFVTIGVFFIASSMLFDAFVKYYEVLDAWVRLMREVLLLVGMYVIVAGAKYVHDELEKMRK